MDNLYYLCPKAVENGVRQNLRMSQVLGVPTATQATIEPGTYDYKNCGPWLPRVSSVPGQFSEEEENFLYGENYRAICDACQAAAQEETSRKK